MRPLMLCFALVGAVGCGGKTAESDAPAPLTVADWKGLPVPRKYAPETLDRLKAGDPALDTPEGWDVFQKTVVGPSRKTDFPSGKR